MKLEVTFVTQILRRSASSFRRNETFERSLHCDSFALFIAALYRTEGGRTRNDILNILHSNIGCKILHVWSWLVSRVLETNKIIVKIETLEFDRCAAGASVQLPFLVLPAVRGANLSNIPLDAQVFEIPK